MEGLQISKDEYDVLNSFIDKFYAFKGLQGPRPRKEDIVETLAVVCEILIGAEAVSD